MQPAPEEGQPLHTPPAVTAAPEPEMAMPDGVEIVEPAPIPSVPAIVPVVPVTDVSPTPAETEKPAAEEPAAQPLEAQQSKKAKQPNTQLAIIVSGVVIIALAVLAVVAFMHAK